MNDQRRLQQKQANRYSALRSLYERTGGSPWSIIPFFEMAANAGLKDDAAQDAFNYLTGERLVKPMTFGGGVSITHDGVKEIENSINSPDRSTPHFSRVVINVHGNVGGVQSGDNNRMNSTQQVDITNENLDNLVEQLRSVISDLDADRRTEGNELVDAFEEEAKSRSPRKSILRSLISSLEQLLLPAASEILAHLTEKLAKF